MGRIRFGLIVLVCITCVSTASVPVTAGIITLDAVDSGWYMSDGVHTSTNENYIVGWSSTTGWRYRDWFVFDLSGVTDFITGARLKLDLPSSGYASSDDYEIFLLSHVETAVDRLRLSHAEDNPEGIAIYGDLGNGPTYGSVSITNDDEGSVVEVVLNDTALSYLNQADSLFALGGKLDTLADIGQAVFQGTYGGNVRQLELTTSPVPEPSTMTIFAMGLVCVAVRTFRRKRTIRKASGVV